MKGKYKMINAPTGDELACKLTNITNQIRLDTFRAFWNDYFDTLEMTSIDIPEMCKMPEDKRNYKINSFINLLLQNPNNYHKFYEAIKDKYTIT